jgi:hypothetical protein
MKAVLLAKLAFLPLALFWFVAPLLFSDARSAAIALAAAQLLLGLAMAASVAVNAESALPGLLFAGAITHGAGVEAVMISGALAAEALVPGLLDTEAAMTAPSRPSPALTAA